MSFSKKKKFIFGSAGFGMPDYGFSSNNKPSSNLSLLNFIYDRGLKHIDTAPSYGFSEETIGVYHQKFNKKFKIWTKVDNLSSNSQYTEDKIFKSVKSSLEKLSVNNIECLYLHQNEVEIIEDKFVQKALSKVKENGLVKKVGVSIYNPIELRSTMALSIYDVIQLPVSVANTLLYNIAKEYHSNKILIARSIFLQGSLLNIEYNRDRFNYYHEISHVVKSLKELAYSYNLNYLEMLIGYVSSLDYLSYIIISSKNKKNMQVILNNSQKKLCNNIKSEINEISMVQNQWTNPRNWLV